MDGPPGKVQGIFLQMKTEEEVVNHILNPSPSNYHMNVTNALFELLNTFAGEICSTDLCSIKDNLERIRSFKSRFLDKIKTVLDKELILTRGWFDLLSKNEVVTDLLRKRGNDYFIQRNFDMALKAYTVAGMYAPKDSKSLALSYSNRSACFAETKNWNKCLEDIKRFEEIWKKIEDDSTPTGDKVAKRKEKCLKEVGEEKISIEKQFGNEFFKLKNPSTVLPALEEFLGVKTDPKKGRGIYNISDKAIEPGTLLILDVPYSHVRNDAFDFQTGNCSACSRILDRSGIPCGGCVFNLYCSEACATSDCHDIHAKYECKIAPYLFELLPKTDFYSDVHLGLSILLKLGPQALLDHYRQIFKKDCGPGTDKDKSDTSSYLRIYNLIHHDEIVSEHEILEYSKYAVVLTEILDFCTDYFACLNLDELGGNLLKEEFSRRILHHQMCLKVNAYPIFYLDLPKGRSPTPEELQLDKPCSVGTGIYPIISLMNHSCAPNATRFYLPGGVMAVMAVEYIVPGQEVLTTYRQMFHNETREERRIDLENRCGFKCECTACTNNWPLMADLKDITQAFRFICPACRMKFEDLDKVQLAYVPSLRLFVCIRRCGYIIRQDDMADYVTSFAELSNGAFMSIFENKILKGFMDAKKCARYLDANIFKPCREVCLAVIAMEKSVRVVARRMFE